MNLHSTMVRLKLNFLPPTWVALGDLHSTMVRLKLAKENGMFAYEYIYLHSTMVRLKPKIIKQYAIELAEFTFHYG